MMPMLRVFSRGTWRAIFVLLFQATTHAHRRFAGTRTPPVGDAFNRFGFPLLGPEPQNLFCVIRSRRSYGKLLVVLLRPSTTLRAGSGFRHPECFPTPFEGGRFYH